MTKTKDLRKSTGFTQKAFAEYFKIPLRTLQKWEIGGAKPAEYLVRLMEYKLRNECIITAEVKENQE